MASGFVLFKGLLGNHGNPKRMGVMDHTNQDENSRVVG